MAMNALPCRKKLGATPTLVLEIALWITGRHGSLAHGRAVPATRHEKDTSKQVVHHLAAVFRALSFLNSVGATSNLVQLIARSQITVPSVHAASAVVVVQKSEGAV
jgi:hypothetical protein